MNHRTPTVKLHPQSWKQIRLGHPWIIKDQYTERFSKSIFLQAFNPKDNSQKVILLNDYRHPKIKARLWNIVHRNDSFNLAIFRKQLYSRLQESVQKRINLQNQRENIYLVFGEGDFLPGLFIQQFKNLLLIQLYTNCYDDNLKILLKYLRDILQMTYPTIKWQGGYIQYRTINTQKKFKTFNWSDRPLPQKIEIKEFNLTYKIDYTSFYDQGIYTDMSSIRQWLAPHIKQCNSLLNLYCYTGAYSLFALQQGVMHVTSVDLSNKYLQWLEENLQLNPQLNPEYHQIHKQDVITFLKEVKANSFDFIICDPPSFSSDGKQSTSAFKQYDHLLPLTLQALKPQGKLAIFLNTHSITKNKFLKKIETLLAESKIKAQIIKHLNLDQDCPRLKGFPEGDYLKGFLIQKN